MKKLFLPAFLLASLLAASVAMAQQPDAPAPTTPVASTTTAPQQEPVVIAIFPFKNITGEVKYDSLAWTFADSLEHLLQQSPEAGRAFTLITVDDIRDQMLAQNIDVKSPSYEGDVWTVAEALGARKIIWGTYIVKYDKANLEAKVIDVKTLMHDRAHFAEKIRVDYGEALTMVPTVAEKILPAMHR